MSKEERTEFYRSVRLEDVDRAIYRWFDRTVDAHVLSPTKDRHKVPVVLASKERWVTAKDAKGMRDQSGRLILPVISVRRTGFNPKSDMSALGVNTPTLTVSKRVSEKTAIVRNAISERPISSRRLQDAVVYEITSIPFPSNGIASYELTIQTQYVQQMNSIIEKIMASLEFYETPCFVATLDADKSEGIGNGKTSELTSPDHAENSIRKPLDVYYFVAFLDSDMSTQDNFTEFTDEERIVKYSLSFTVPVYMHLDPEGKPVAVRKTRTAFNVRFGDEQTTFVDDPYEIELIFDNKGKVEER